MPDAHVVNDGSTVHFDALTDLESGTLLEVPDGRAGLVAGSVPAGAKAAAYVRARVEVAKASATVFAAGVQAGFDTATRLAVTGAGTFNLGLVSTAAGAGLTTVQVDLNVPAPA